MAALRAHLEVLLLDHVGVVHLGEWYSSPAARSLGADSTVYAVWVRRRKERMVAPGGVGGLAEGQNRVCDDGAISVGEL